jgi:hypothetical protein
MPTTLTHPWLVGETPTDPTGTPTVTVVAADGVSVQSGNATIVGGSSGQTTFALNAVATLEYLTVTWTATVAGVSRVETDYVEIVGGFFFTLAEGRASDSSLSSTVSYPTAAIELNRFRVETECERICDRAFTPQYQRVVLDGTGTSEVMLEHSTLDRSPADIRTIRNVQTAIRADESFTAFSVAELAAVQVTEDMMLRRVDGQAWPEGLRNVIVEYEYGLDGAPPDLVQASLVRLLYRLNIHKQSQPENALSYQVDGGGSYRLALPGPYSTGIAGIDAVYQGYSRRERTGPGGSQGVPASRTLSYNVQRYSVYH